MKLRQNNILKRRNYSIKKAIVSSLALVPLMVILSLVPAQCGADPSDTMVSIVPVSQTVDPGDSFTIEVTIDPGEPIAGAQVDILFDPTYLTVDSVADGGMFDMWVGSELDIDNVAGMVDNIVSFDLGNVSSPGVLAILECTAKMIPGTTTFALDDVIIGNPEGFAVPVELIDGSVTIFGEPPDENEFFSNVELVGFDSDSDGLMDAVEVLMNVDTTGGFVDVTVAGELEDPNMFVDDTSQVSWTIYGSDEDYESLYLYANGPEGEYDISLVLTDESYTVEDNWSGTIYLYPPLYRPTTIIVSPPSQLVEPGDTFTIDITIDPGVPIAGAQANMVFNPSLVTIDMIETGDMFDEWLDTALEIDNINGAIRNIIAFDLDNVTIPGTFATITMTAGDWNGVTPLTLENALVSNPDALPVSLLLSHGNVTIINGIEPDESFVDVELVGFDSDSDGLMDAVEVLMNVDTTSGFVDVTVAGELEDPNMFVDDTGQVSWTIYGSDEDYESLYLYANGPEGEYDISLKLYDDRMNLEDTWNGSIFLSSPLYGCYVNITPSSQIVYGNDIYCFNITVNPLEAIKGVEASLLFDPELITLLDVQEGDLFNGYLHTFNTDYTLDNTQGRLSGISGALLSPEDSITAPGTLAMICYQASSIDDVSPLDLINVIVCGSDGQPVQPFVTDGMVTILLHDTTPPEIENIQALPPCNHSGGYVNLSGMITDDVGLADVSIHIIYPNLNEETFSLMASQVGDTYYHNQTYLQPGHYTFIFEATDLEENSLSSPAHTFCITNLYPVADFTWYPLSICPNDTIFFDATSSYDSDGFIIEYNWSYIPSGSPSPPISMGTGDILSYSWMTEGTYDVTLEVTDQLGDIGVLTQTIQVGYPTISVAIDPVTQTVGNEETFQVDIIVDPGQDTCAKIAGVQFTLSFDPALLMALEITEGNFFEGLDSYFCNDDLGYAWCSINNTLGMITGVAGVTNTSGGYVATSGTFATITFMADILAGTSPLNLSNVIVGDRSGVSLPVSLGNGSVTIQDTLSPQISNVTASPPFQVTGGFVNLSGMVTDNMGLADVTLELIYPDFAMETISILNNQSGSTYYCNRTYVQPGEYTFTLQASDPSGNSYTSPSYTYCIYPPLYVNITPSSQFVCNNETFTVDVTVDTRGWTCVPLAGVQFNLLFDPALLTVDNVTEGDLFNGLSSHFTCPPDAPSWCDIDNSDGRIMNISGVITTPGGFVSTSGTFATITFTAGSLVGTANLDLVDDSVIVGDMYGHSLPLIINDGVVKIGIYTHKEIGDPSHGEYVTSTSEFELTGMTCSGEIEAVYYRIWDKETWNPHTGYWTPWTQYTDSFTLDNECTHYLEYYSVDTMGNTEVVNNQTHYVDDTSPISWKIVGEPHYDEQYCQCQWVTTSTPITLSALDRGKCVVGQWRIFYRIWHDGSWSPWQTGDWNEDITLYFEEECKHYLEWYAQDILGNTEPVHNQTHYVDDTPPVTTKTIGSPKQDDYVTTATSITLEANDEGLCAVGFYKIYYKINDELFEGDWNEPVVFTFEEECEHVLEYWSVDSLGNEEEHTLQTHYVDDTAPYTDKIIGEPEWGYFSISSGESITIYENTTCLYVQTFPVTDIINGGIMFNTSADEMYILSSTGHNLFIECYRPARDDIGNNIVGVRLNGVPGYPDGIWATVVIDYTLGPDGIGTSAPYALGNTMTTSTKLGDIYSTITLGFGSYITSQTPITLEPHDTLGSCVAGIGHTYYRVWYNGTWSPWNEYTGPFSLDELNGNGGDCLHYLEWYSIDLLGNNESAPDWENLHNQTHYVDDTAPVISKTVGLPSDGDYVTTSTNITLEASDEGACASGVKEIHYVINGVETVVSGDSVTFTFMEECVHELEFWAVDNLGNEGEHILQTHYVDDTPPVSWETLGDPHHITECCTWITTDTPITLSAVDLGTCAVGSWRIHWQIWLEGTMIDYGTGDWNTPVTLYFDEECKHCIKWRTEDDLGNTELVYNTQIYYVDDTPPSSSMDYGEPVYVSGEDVYISPMTPIYINVSDGGLCPVNCFTVYYRLWNQSQGWSEWQSGTSNLSLLVSDTCMHYIEYYAVDCLGNNESGVAWSYLHNHSFFVDTQSPVTQKELGAPSYQDGYWVTPATRVWLNSSDMGEHVVPVECLHYEIWWDSDTDGIVDALMDSVTICDNTVNDSDSTVGYISVSFTFGEECLHEIRWYAWDILGNYEQEHQQQHWVDNQTPILSIDVEGPYHLDDLTGDHYLSSAATLHLTTVDPNEPCASGVQSILYQIEYNGIIHPVSLDDYYCTNENITDDDGMYWYIYSDASVSFNFIRFHENCTHYLTVKVIDNVGQSSLFTYTYHVDNIPTMTTLEVGDPQYGDFVTTQTPIWLNTTDMGDCAVGCEFLHWEVLWWNETSGEWEWQNSCYESDNMAEFTFNEECIHKVVWWSGDYLGNNESTHEMIFKVDDTPPLIEKTVGQPQYTGNLPMGEYYVNQSTPLWITATDTGMGDCIVGSVHINVCITYLGEETWYSQEVESGTASIGPFYLSDGEGKYYVNVTARDNLGNVAYDNETFIVDNTPPALNKTVGSPRYIGDLPPGDYYINTTTPIWLETLDMSGTQGIYYGFDFNGTLYPRNMSDNYCGNLNITEIRGTYWYVYYNESVDFGPIMFHEEGIHILTVMTQDNLGHYILHTETFIVDATPPVTTKIIGDPSYDTDTDTITEYVTTSTPIWFTATDISDIQGTYYRIWYDDTWHPVDMNDSYCGNSNITEIDGAYWYVYYNDSVDFGPIMFHEECIHHLQFFSIDNLGQKEAVFTQTHYVDDTAPISFKHIGKPQYDTECCGSWVTTHTPITLSAIEIGDCKVGFWRIHWEIQQNGFTLTTGTGDWNTPVVVYFAEECNHTIIWWAEDALGNLEEIHTQSHYVDDTPPVTTKTIGKPSYWGNYWLTTNTSICLTATDQGECIAGVDFIHYEIWWDSDNDSVVDTKIADETIPDDSVCFTLSSEGLYTLKWYAVDYLGNMEEENSQEHKVDNTPPSLNKDIGEPKYDYDPPHDYYITGHTPIYINMSDALTNSTLHYCIYYNGTWHNYTSSSNVTFTLGQFSWSDECHHLLKVWAIDDLGNRFDLPDENLYRDDTPSSSVKFFCCNSVYEDGENEYITSRTYIVIEAEDTGTCISGVKEIRYNISVWNETQEAWVMTQNDTHYCGPFRIFEECKHKVTWWTYDNLLNKEAIQENIFHVDNTPPQSMKHFDGPLYITNNGTEEYIHANDTQIVLTATDYPLGPCASGVKEIWYQVWIWNDEAWELEQNDTLYTGPFTITEKCKHKLVYWAIDNLDNREPDNINVFYVDGTPPVSQKAIGSPSHDTDGDTIPEYVKTGTPLWINITDLGYCSAGVNYTSIKIWRDITGDGVVDELLNGPEGDLIYDGEPYNGDYVKGDLDGIKNGCISLEIRFLEECYHKIEWYSVDYVKNNETVQTQFHYVDDTVPDTSKEIGQPYYGDFVTTQTPIWLNTTDPGQCAVGVNYLHWEIYQWNETTSEWVWRKSCCGSSGHSSNTARIYFDEECKHKIVWWSVDYLGNTENVTEQIHYVDDTPPITTKTIIGGFHGDIIENGTTVVLNATDYGCTNGVGTMSLHYEIWWDSDNDSVVDFQKVNATILDDGIEDLDLVFGKILHSYTFNQIGYHEIWWYSTDYLGNQETVHIQSHYVDDTPSITTKEIGQPKYPKEGPFMGDYVTTETLIWLNATTPDGPGEANVSMTHIWVWWDSDNNGTVDYLLDNATIIDGAVYSNGTHIMGDLDGMVNGEIYVQIQFLEECYHEIWWYSVDLVGNTETLHKQGHHVDATSPTTTLTVGAPSFGDFVTTLTPIWLNTTDTGNCAVGCDYIHWEVYWWNSTSMEWILENYGDDYDNQAEIYLARECKHRLEWWSVDFLGNMEEEQEHIFYVDDTTPEIIKTVGLPQYTQGLPPGDYYVTNETPFWVNVTDMGLDPCIVGSLNLTIAIEHQGTTIYTYAEATNGTLSIGPFYLEPDGIHYVNITVRDNLGNTKYDHEIFYVDSQAPLTQKTIGEPQYDNGNWTTSHTPIYLNTTDQGEYPVGCDYLHWEIWWWNETSSTWNLLESGIDYGNQAEIYFDEECTHKIIWWAIDHLGNEETVHEQYHYVDDTPPTTIKTIMGPVYEDYVSFSTTLLLNATDEGCLGGIGVQYLHYEVWWDSDNDTSVDTQVDNVTIYDNEIGDLNPTVGEITIDYQFSQECYHEIWWHSIDYLANQEIMHAQSHQVDNTPPHSHKEMCCGGFYIDDQENEWINHDTHIFLEAEDPGTCASGVDEIWYQIWLWDDGTGWNQIQNDTLYTSPFTIQEDCYHKIVWWAIDKVNNTESARTNEFYVEGNPPIITNSIGHPYYPGDLPHEYYVTNTTPIWINATDNTTGDCVVGSVNLTVTVEYLGVQTQYHTIQVVSGLATLGPLYLEGDCIHYVNVTARDNIGNTAYANYTFYVDITPPISEKTIISPSYDNGNWTGVPATIWINATDPGICAVGVCHTFIEVWYDNDSDDIVDTLLDSAIICDGACTHDGTHIAGDLDETVNGKIDINVSFLEECYHEIHWYSVDCFGNTETLHNQSHRADNTPPSATIEYGAPNITSGDLTYFSPLTPIFLNATDEQNNCSVNCYTIYYRIWNQSSGWTEWLLGELDTNLTIFITDSCMHYLEYYAQDCVGNKEGIHNQTIYIDATPPTTIKEIGLQDCNDSYNVTDSTLFWLNATDTGDCSTGISLLHYEIWWDDDNDTVLSQVHTEDVPGDTISFDLGTYGVLLGLCEIRWYSTDMIGNIEDEHQQSHWVQHTCEE